MVEGESAIFAAGRGRRAAAAAAGEPNSCQPRTLRRPTPRLQNSKFQPQPQLVNMTAGKSSSRSRFGPFGGQFWWFRLENVDKFFGERFLDCLWCCVACCSTAPGCPAWLQQQQRQPAKALEVNRKILICFNSDFSRT